METNSNQNTKIFVACLLTLIGCTLLGLGIGIMVSAVWTYVILGVGTGFLVSAIIFFKNYNNRPESP